jgi:hypothetical protein
MIYAPILDKPIIELDEYFDLGDIPELEKKMAYAIARNKKNITVAFSGPSGEVHTWLPNENFIEVKDAWVPVNQKLQDEDEWNLLSHDQQLFYTLLTTKSRSLNQSLAIRTLNSMGGNAGKFHLKHLTSETIDTPVRKDFDFLFDWINKQEIFDEFGRVVVFLNPEGNCTPIHRDYPSRSQKDQFLWIRFNKQKDFFVYDTDTQEKHFTKGYISTFDNHQWHGGEPSEVMGFSLRIDGIFSSEFLEKTGLINHFKI